MAPLALPAVSGPVFQLDAALLAQGCAAARQSPRKRMAQPLHRTQQAPVQRLLNFLEPGTYIRPHCHAAPGATETVMMLAGSLHLLIFNPAGTITAVHTLTAGTTGAVIDLEPGVWHGMLCRESGTVLLECKQGPYDALLDKTFAAWAPEEYSPSAGPYIDSLTAAAGP